MSKSPPEQFLDRFGALARAVRLAAAQTYATFDVGSTQARFLRYLKQHPGSSQAELARATVTDPTLTGRVLESLIERGWIERERSKDDRRQYVLELTAAGRRACAKVDSARAQIAERMVRSLEERDLRDFERIAAKLLEVLEGSDAQLP